MLVLMESDKEIEEAKPISIKEFKHYFSYLQNDKRLDDYTQQVTKILKLHKQLD